MSKKKLLIIGYGNMGKLHAKYAEILGVDWEWSDPAAEGPDSRRSEKNPSAYPSAYTHIIIATPAEMHGKQLRDIEKAGYWGKILVEKPGVTKYADTAYLKKPLVSVGLVERFNPSFITLKRAVNPSRVLCIDFVRCSARPVSRIKESSFVDVGMHDLDLLFQIFGDDCIRSSNIVRKGNTFTMSALLSNGALARFIWSNETFHKEREIKVRQEDCNFTCDLIEQTVRKYALSSDNKNTVESIYVEKASPLLQQLRSFLAGERVDGYKSNLTFLNLLSEIKYERL